MPRPYNAWLAEFVVVFANGGVIIADSRMIIVGAEILMAGLRAVNDV